MTTFPQTRLLARKIVTRSEPPRTAALPAAEAEPKPTARAESSGPSRSADAPALSAAQLRHPPSESLGSAIRSRRLELGLTQDDVSERAEIAKSYISQIETGVRRSPPSEPVLRRLERALSFTPGTLVELGRWEATPASVKKLVREIDGQVSHLADALRAAAAVSGENARVAGRAGTVKGTASLDELFKSGVLARLVGGQVSAGESLDARSLAQLARARRVPVVNRVAAGVPTGYTDLDHPAGVADEYVEAPEPPLDDADLFAARVTGDSMSPEYRDGDIVIFSPIVTVTDGMDCYARLEPDHESTFKRVFFERSDNPSREGEDGRPLSGQMVRLQPLNPAHDVRVLPRERIAGLYAAVSVVRRLPISRPSSDAGRTLHCGSVGA